MFGRVLECLGKYWSVWVSFRPFIKVWEMLGGFGRVLEVLVWFSFGHALFIWVCVFIWACGFYLGTRFSFGHAIFIWARNF